MFNSWRRITHSSVLSYGRYFREECRNKLPKALSLALARFLRFSDRTVGTHSSLNRKIVSASRCQRTRSSLAKGPCELCPFQPRLAGPPFSPSVSLSPSDTPMSIVGNTRRAFAFRNWHAIEASVYMPSNIDRSFRSNRSRKREIDLRNSDSDACDYGS